MCIGGAGEVDGTWRKDQNKDLKINIYNSLAFLTNLFEDCRGEIHQLFFPLKKISLPLKHSRHNPLLQMKPVPFIAVSWKQLDPPGTTQREAFV